MSAAAAMNDAILKVDHLSMKFGGLVAIGDLSFEARRGEITALIGPNGAGKTTVFNCITGFYKPSEGMITLTRKDGSTYLLERLPNHEIPARAKVARTFQNIRLFSGMTVLENLLVAQHNKLMKASGYTILGLLGIGGYAKASAESIDLAKFWLDKADLTSRADDPAGDLPYGAQRRLEIARAMCTGPELLCLDEPAAGLNPRESLVLNALLNDIKDNTGTSILLIEHDMSVVMQISDHVVVLEYGRKISDGNPGHVKNDPKVIAAYLGVDDDEVGDVLAEVGDEGVIEQLDAEPDAEHGPLASSSMLAGPVSDSIGHSDMKGEVVRVSPGASKAAQVESRAARDDAAAKSAAAAASKAPAKSSPRPAAPVQPAASKPVASKPPAQPLMGTSGNTPPPKAAKSSAPKRTASSTTAVPVKKAAQSGKMASSAPAQKKSAPVAASQSASRNAKPAAKSSNAAPAAAGKTKPAAATKPAAKASPVVSAKLSNALAAARGGKADRLILIKGIGPVNEKKLNEHGIFHFDQIATWKRSDIVAAEAYLAFDGRIDREDWIRQAKQLAKQAGPTTASSKRGGRK